MTAEEKLSCGECETGADQQTSLARRDFLRVVGGGALWLAANGGPVPQLLAAQQGTPQAPARAAKPAEALIQELYQGLTNAQRSSVVYPWNHGGGGNAIPTRHRMFNTAFGQQASQVYTAPQRELVQRIIRAICSDEEGFRRIATVIEQDNWNRSGWNGVGANIFGNPAQGQYAFVLTAHHMTIRCDGNSEPNAAFGGPMYYGHIVDGMSQRNVFNYQTRSVRSVFDALTNAQRQQALVQGTPGELAQSIRFRPAGQRIPGLASGDLTSDQRNLVAMVLRDLLAPFRREDADEVMDIVRRNGGLERIHLAFYRDRGASDNTRWNFWRIEGPGFVWNYRILPHVHCYVNVAAVTT
jgi:hypothetical protein